jgi:hypothetical protein
MRKALVVGINHYTSISPLFGCVDDAHAMKSVLERNSDGSINFGVKLLTGTGPTDTVSRTELKESVRDLFNGDSEVALFYFAGHGYIETTGGYLLTTECTAGDAGLPLQEVMTLANGSAARNKIIVLDSCHSGITGTPPGGIAAQLNEGMTILTASSAEQYASEENGGGVFTTLFVDALGGAAANLLGEITPGSVYAHIDQSLGPWEQRPVFKTNVKSFVSLRRVQPPISLADLQRITDLFPSPGFEVGLDPSFEPESGSPNEANTRIFEVLQRYNKVNLVIPIGATHMYHAAIGSESCKLTVLGEHYRRLVERGRI